MFYVYVITHNNEEVLYIGHTCDYKKRVSTHMREGTAEHGKSYITVYCFVSEIDSRISELYLINKMNPKYNKDHPTGECSYKAIMLNRDEKAETWLNDKIQLKFNDFNDDLLHITGAYRT